MYTLSDVLALDADGLFAIMQAAHPLDEAAIADTSYTGIDLSMPALFHRLFWKSFRKTFHRDPVSGRLRGWNVKVEQTGWDTPPAPKRDRGGAPITFGHYEVRGARGLTFPRGWEGSHYLDYRDAGNCTFDFPANRGYCPLVQVNAGNADLLLGWEVFRLGAVNVPIRDFWVLVREGPLAPSDVVAPPVPRR